MVYKFFDKKKGSGMSVNEEPAQELYKLMITNLKQEKTMLGLTITYGQQIEQKWDQCLLLIVVLNIYYMS